MVLAMLRPPVVCTRARSATSDMHENKQHGYDFYDLVFHLGHLAGLKVIKSSFCIQHFFCRRR